MVPHKTTFSKYFIQILGITRFVYVVLICNHLNVFFYGANVVIILMLSKQKKINKYKQLKIENPKRGI